MASVHGVYTDESMAVFIFPKIRFVDKLNLNVRLLSTLSRPVAKLSEDVEDKINNGDNPKKHSGVFNRGVSQLPEKLRAAIDKVIEDKADSTLLTAANALHNHLIYKKAPLTEDKLQLIKSEIVQEVNTKYPSSEEFPYLSAKEQRSILDFRNNKIQRLFTNKAYKWKAVTYDEKTAIHYLIARVAPDFASLSYVLKEISLRDPTFRPKSLFDFGSGIGTSIWAAKSFWNSSLKEFFCVDSSFAMNNLALQLLEGGTPNSKSVDSDSTSIKGLYFRQFMPTSAAVKFDLVICAHSLLELPSFEQRLQTALSLWQKSQGYLVFVEHGSRAAHEVLMEVRHFLLGLSESENQPQLTGHVFSPCSHELSCPRLAADNTPCNFEVKYEPLLAKSKSFMEKERFSYVVLKKGSRPDQDPQWPRVVRPVLSPARHTVCRVCTKNGKLEEVVITRGKHNKITNHCARKTVWGDLLPVDLNSPVQENEIAEEDPTPGNL